MKRTIIFFFLLLQIDIGKAQSIFQLYGIEYDYSFASSLTESYPIASKSEYLSFWFLDREKFSNNGIIRSLPNMKGMVIHLPQDFELKENIRHFRNLWSTSEFDFQTEDSVLLSKYRNYNLAISDSLNARLNSTKSLTTLLIYIHDTSEACTLIQRITKRVSFDSLIIIDRTRAQQGSFALPCLEELVPRVKYFSIVSPTLKSLPVINTNSINYMLREVVIKCANINDFSSLYSLRLNKIIVADHSSTGKIYPSLLKLNTDSLLLINCKNLRAKRNLCTIKKLTYLLIHANYPTKYQPSKNGFIRSMRKCGFKEQRSNSAILRPQVQLKKE